MANADEIARLGKRFVKIFYDPIPTNDDVSGAPIWCLGTRYESSPLLDSSYVSVSPNSPQDSTMSRASDLPEPDDAVHTKRDHTPWTEDAAVKEAVPKPIDFANDEGGWPAPFLHDFESRIWFTYRSGFAAIPKSQQPNAAGALSFAVRLRTQLGQPDGFTSDTGWGCMIRSGQSLLANTLLLSRLGRGRGHMQSQKPRKNVNMKLGWRIGTHVSAEREIVSLFADDQQAPFSVHKFVEHGASACGKHPGEWFGPSATARCIQYVAHNLDLAFDANELQSSHQQAGIGRPTCMD